MCVCVCVCIIVIVNSMTFVSFWLQQLWDFYYMWLYYCGETIVFLIFYNILTNACLYLMSIYI